MGTKNKKIVIPTDFSADSNNAIRHGLQLASVLKWDVLLIHSIIIRYPEAGQLGTTNVQFHTTETREREEAARKRMNEMVEELYKTVNITTNLDYKIKFGLVEDAVISEIKPGEDIVMIHGGGSSSSLDAFFTDSLNRLFEDLNTPVFVIPPTAAFQPFNNVVYATDFREEDKTALKKLVGILRPFNSRITILHVIKEESFEEEIESEGFIKLIRKKIDYENFSYETLKTNDVVEGILNSSEKNNTDLITLLKEKEGFWSKLFTKSKTQKVVFNTDKPVLVFHQNKK